MASPLRLAGRDRPLAVLIAETAATGSRLQKFVVLPRDAALPEDEPFEVPETAVEHWAAIRQATAVQAKELAHMPQPAAGPADFAGHHHHMGGPMHEHVLPGTITDSDSLDSEGAGRHGALGAEAPSSGLEAGSSIALQVFQHGGATLRHRDPDDPNLGVKDTGWAAVGALGGPQPQSAPRNHSSSFAPSQLLIAVGVALVIGGAVAVLRTLSRRHMTRNRYTAVGKAHPSPVAARH